MADSYFFSICQILYKIGQCPLSFSFISLYQKLNNFIYTSMDRAKNTKPKPSNKQTQLLGEILQKITQNRLSFHFRLPVDWKALGLQDYPLLIIEPMDLSTVQSKLKGYQYASSESFFQDLLLIWRNCQIYNGEGHWLSIIASKLEQETNRYLKNYFPNIKLKRKKLSGIKRQMENGFKFQTPKKGQGCILDQLNKLFIKKCEEEDQQDIQQANENVSVISQECKIHYQNNQQRAQKATQYKDCKEEHKSSQYQIKKAGFEQNDEKQLADNQMKQQHPECSQNSDLYNLRLLFMQALETVPEERASMLFLLIKRRCLSSLSYDEKGDSIVNLKKVDYQTLYLGMMQILRWNECSQ